MVSERVLLEQLAGRAGVIGITTGGESVFCVHPTITMATGMWALAFVSKTNLRSCSCKSLGLDGGIVIASVVEL